MGLTIMSDKQTVKFGDICKEAKLTTKDPIGDGYERYIGLEHLDSGSLKIKRWGMIAEDNPSFTRVFKKGQILFGKRRPYLKKAAIAEFDGICSGDIIVLEAIEGAVKQEDLPYIIQTDVLWDWAVKTSSGSLSPRTKFKDLAECVFEFGAEIGEICELLKAMHNVFSSKNDAYRSLVALEDAVIKDVLTNSTNQVLEMTGQELLDNGYLTLLQDGNHGSQYPRKNEFVDSGLPYLSAQNIDDMGNVYIDECPRLTEDRANKLRIKPAIGGDVILTHNATVGRVAVLDKSLGTVIGSTSTTYYRVNPEKLSARYLAAFMRSSFFQNQLSRLMRQSTRNQVPITTQKKLIFLLPGIEVQELIEKMNSYFDFKKQIADDVCETRLKQCIENEYF
ncbi:Type I restriction enzyme S subunit [Vibrio crassostreae]|nr:Type I restriction enzyme S subunit [Vibrio crassostreae]CAK1867826.1 Type I restriction enzyme S subunit [Vibrio crassostreae]CAK1995907.1 Type I restriction enzyme S subunit [Vibrio crassostreae]CAK1996570.1 Type I restriction enzyme S subunit [Vibrio crassostreae]CAK1999569.1 Type I restriction enzyme S subunit [Vibrio crassostreae]